jgi:hypothetical protein
MMQRQPRMMHQHSGSRVTHDRFGFFPHVWAIAVYGAFAAGALLLLERALVQPQHSIVEEFGAFRAEFTFLGAVFLLAVVSHHGVYGFLFSFYSRMLFGCRGQFPHLLE